MADGQGPPPLVSDIPPDVARRAVQWQVELQSCPESEAVHRAHRDWLAGHPDHQRAWARIEAVNQRLREVAATSVLAQATLVPARTRPRRRVVRALGVVLLSGGVAWQLERQAPWQEWATDERTGVGERRTVTLADGGTVVLNTDTAIDVRFGASERRLRIVRGEVFVTTGLDAGWAGRARPFVVQTLQGELRPLGTRFAVRQHADATHVAVLEGAVAVHPHGLADRGEAGPAFILRVGQQVRFAAGDIGPVHPASEAETAWVNGMLVASGMRLDEFLKEVGRHRPGSLRCDPAVAHLRVSGTYPLSSTDRVLALLATSMPVEVRFFTRWWVTVGPRL